MPFWYLCPQWLRNHKLWTLLNVEIGESKSRFLSLERVFLIAKQWFWVVSPGTGSVGHQLLDFLVIYRLKQSQNIQCGPSILCVEVNADLGAIFSIDQNWPTIKAVYNKIPNFFCAFFLYFWGMIMGRFWIFSSQLSNPHYSNKALLSTFCLAFFEEWS